MRHGRSPQSDLPLSLIAFVALVLTLLMGLAAAVCRGAEPAPAPTNLQDLRDAHAKGLPYVALWPVDGFDVAWHAAQLPAGRRIMPSIRLPDPDYWQGTIAPPEAALRAIAAANVPLVLRTNNIRDAIADRARNRSTDPAIAATQGAVYSLKTDATGKVYADQEPFCDCLAPPAFWRNEGAAWARTKWYQALKSYYPQPPLTFLVENNEGAGYEQLTRYLVPGGTLKPYAGLQPIGTIRAASERMANWVAARPATTPDDIVSLRSSALQAQYDAFYSGFSDAKLTGGYGGVLTNMMVEYPWTGAYASGTLRYDAVSPNWYINSPNLGDFTNCRLACVTNAIPAWDQAEARNPNAWRELSVQLTNGAAIAGPQAGKHLPIRPPLWGGYCQYLLWDMQSPNRRACVLRHYEGAATKPTDRLYVIDTSKLTGDNLAAALAWNAAQPGILAGINASDMLTVTFGDYVLAEAAACDHICTDPTLRDFWLNARPMVTGDKLPTDLQQAALKWPQYPLPGTPDNRGRLLPCDVNDPTSAWRYLTDKQAWSGNVKVWACATKHPDGRVLVYAWTACAGMGLVNVNVLGDNVPLDFAGGNSGYWILTKPNGWSVRKL